MIYQPDNPQIRMAWHECLKWMQKEINLCKEKNIKCILLISPHRFQVDLDSSLAIPQKILREFALTNSLEYIDLLPILKEKMQNKDTGEGARKYFLDYDQARYKTNRIPSLERI